MLLASFCVTRVLVLQGSFARSWLRGSGTCCGADGFYKVRALATAFTYFAIRLMTACRWERTREIFAGIFKQKTQAEWCKVFDGTDACATPVLRPEQLHEHPLHMARLVPKLNALAYF